MPPLRGLGEVETPERPRRPPSPSRTGTEEKCGEFALEETGSSDIEEDRSEEEGESEGVSDGAEYMCELRDSIFDFAVGFGEQGFFLDDFVESFPERWGRSHDVAFMDWIRLQVFQRRVHVKEACLLAASTPRG